MTVHHERRGPLLIVRLDRPAKRNAIDRETADGIDAALNELEDEPDLWVGIITGTSEVFSAGTDLTQRRSPATDRGGEYGVIRRDRRKPLIAAVEGFALGGGFEIVLACDLVVAAETASFGLPEVSRGLIPTCGGLFRTARALPLNIAKELLLTGDRLSAARGAELGLVNRVTPPGAALEAAVQLAERICLNAPLSVRESMRALERVVAADDEQAWAASDESSEIALGSADAREGTKAFFERRTPQWTAN
jgi:enoyl-CoA hydratase